MATKAKQKKSTPSMRDLVPGAMPEAMVKGCLVDEDPVAKNQHGKVARMTWGKAVERLIKVRGGNLTWNEAYLDDTPSSAVEELVAAEDDSADEDDFDSLLADLDDDDEPEAEPEVEDLDALLDEATSRFKEGMDLPDEVYDGSPLFIGMPSTKDYIFDGHAGAGPSGAERWMNCTASLGAARAFLETLTPNQQAEFAKGSEAARQGTTAHAAAESEARLMLGQITDEEHEYNLLELTMLPESDGEAYDEEMAEWLVEYGLLLKQFADDGHPVLIETRVEATIPLMTVDEDGDPDVHTIAGSADAIALPIPVEPVLSVVDLKYGNGKNVEAEDNPQAMIYALAVLALLMEDGLDIFDKKVLSHIELVIVQPRLGGIKTWLITVDELLDWQDNVLSKALTEALGGKAAGASFTPGEVQCQWCPARGNCVALADSVFEGAADLFDTIQDHEFAEGVGSPLDVQSLPPERLSALLAQAEAVVKIKDDLKAEAQRRLHRGTPVPGFHLVNYTPKSEWVEDAEETLDPDHVDEDFLDPRTAALLFKRSMLSPTQAAKTLKANGIDPLKVESLIVRPDKRPVVAREGDRRKVWEGKPPEQMFADDLDDA